MRILLATGVYPPEIGGPATAMSVLATELRDAGHEVVVLTYGDPRPEPGVAAVSRQGNVFQRYLRFASLARKLMAASDVVVATDVFSVGIPVRAALIGRKTRFVLRLGGEWAWEDAVEKGRTGKPLRAFWKDEVATWRMRLVKLDYAWIMDRASTVVVTSDWLKNLLAETFPASATKLQTVWNEALVEPVPVASDARPHVPLRLAYIGRFAKVKNVPMLARALKAAVAQGAAVECVFVGSGDALAQCKDILHGVPGMYFMGAVTHGSLPDILSETDLLVLPSLSDICPNAVIEAVATGVPCLITTEHGLPRPVSGTMELYPLDEQAWTDAVVRLSGSKNAYVELRDAVRPMAMPQGKGLAEAVIA